MDEAGFKALAVTQRNPDFMQLASACGWQGLMADKLETLAQHLAQAFSMDGTNTVQALIQINENEL